MHLLSEALQDSGGLLAELLHSIDRVLVLCHCFWQCLTSCDQLWACDSSIDASDTLSNQPRRIVMYVVLEFSRWTHDRCQGCGMGVMLMTQSSLSNHDSIAVW